MIVSPVTYQGAKNRIAKEIVDILNPDKDKPFYDLCCGGGSISIELVNRGFNPNLITMLDAGPWGSFWQHVGDGSFNLVGFKDIVFSMPTDPKDIYKFIVELSKQPATGQQTIFNFLLLQAASFGGKAIHHLDGKWVHAGFRQYWLPTSTSSRRSPVNPMMPMPPTIYDRVSAICERMYGVTGYQMDIRDFKPNDGTIYIDPPYQATEAYGAGNFSVKELPIAHRFFVSEAKPLSSDYWLISEPRTKGGITGINKNGRNQEYLSAFN